MATKKELQDANRSREIWADVAKALEEELTETKRKLAIAVEALLDYSEHSDDCILARWQACSPDQGWKYAGKWYTEQPPCECGLDDVIKEINGD